MPVLARRRKAAVEAVSRPDGRRHRLAAASYDLSGIVDEAALGRALETVAGSGPDPTRALTDLVKAALTSGRAVIQERFMADQDGARVLSGTSHLIDVLVRALHRVATSHLFRVANPTKGEHIAVVAVGGYGRSELAPFSDIDLLFLLPYKQTPHTEQIVEFLYYVLWDAGLKIGHATRSIDECIRQAGSDFSIRTSILEMRFLSGEISLYHELEQRFRKEVVGGSAAAFVDAKLAERDERHRRLGDSRYVLEPNIKEGKGGLRDLHGLLWIVKYVFGIRTIDELVRHGTLSANEARRFHRDQQFLWTVRCHLHYLTQRPEDRLTFEVQEEIGRRMGYRDHAGSRGVERFMKHYFLVAKDVGELTRFFLAVIEVDQKRRPVRLWRRLLPGGTPHSVEGFRLDGGRLAMAREDAFAADPVNLIRLFHVAQRTGLDIHPSALRQVTLSLRLIDARFRNNRNANRLFLEILTSPNDPERALRQMGDAGVLGRFIPDFGRVVAQMQYDMYHVFTVDEHTLFAVGMLHKIETGQLREELPLATSIIGSIDSRRALYVAVLLHDIAKGRKGDHSEIGARIAIKLGARFGLTREEIEAASWLVRHHLLMSRTAFKRDIEDPKTIQDFVASVQSPERLKLLVILTVADIRAVGPKVWNGWKGALLRDLYSRAQELMSGSVPGGTRHARVARTQQEVRTLLTDFTDEDFSAFVRLGYPFYWLTNDTDALARHARLIRQAGISQAPVTVTTRVETRHAVTEVTVYTTDHAGLFSRLAGAFAVAGAQIVDARIFTMTNGMALDTFWIQRADGSAFDRPDRLTRLAALFEKVLQGKLDPRIELKRAAPFPSRTGVFTVPPRVLIDNSASSIHTVIEVNGRDRPGLLFDLTRALNALGLQIAGAKIATYGEKVVDVFFVKDVFGLKVEQEPKLVRIRNRLLKVIEKGDDTPMEDPPTPAKRGVGLAPKSFLLAAALLPLLGGCSKHPAADEGLTVHQTVAIGDERRLEILEDERITPALRVLMWGGSKDPAWLLAQPGIGDDRNLARSLEESQGFRRGVLRLTDRAGTVLAERRLDCELGEIAEPALPQGAGSVWGIGDDCSTGGGDFAGLVTRFLIPASDAIRFETYREAGSDRPLELTLVSAERIRWHLDPPGDATEVHEISSHPDFDDPRFTSLKPGDPPPASLPWVVDYLTYRWNGPAGWTKTVRTERSASWAAEDAWPEETRFPPPVTP